MQPPADIEPFADVLRGAQLDPDEAAVFLAAARVLQASGRLPGTLAGTAEQVIWPHTGMAPPAPASMPKQPLAPGVFGCYWRRLRAALALSPGNESR